MPMAAPCDQEDWLCEEEMEEGRDEPPVQRRAWPMRSSSLALVVGLGCMGLWAWQRRGPAEGQVNDAVGFQGLTKAKEYDWKDSNMALSGGQEGGAGVKKAASEPAWDGAGAKVGLQIWRINKFRVEEWPEEQYGEFYSGDSYIVLNTESKDGEMSHDLRFWVGKESTEDEYNTAAAKCPQLRALLKDKPTPHREVQDQESEVFKGYFKAITLLEGGAESGFNRVVPTKYRTRLLKITGSGKKIAMEEVPVKCGSLSQDSTSILDGGQTVYLIEGENRDTAFKAAQEVKKLLEGRKNAKTETVKLADVGSHVSLKKFLTDC